MSIRMVTCPGCGSIQKDGITCPLCRCPVNDTMRQKIKKERENKITGQQINDGINKGWTSEAILSRQKTFVELAMEDFTTRYPMFPVTVVDAGIEYNIKTKTSELYIDFYMNNYYTLIMNAESLSESGSSFKPIKFYIDSNLESPVQKISESLRAYADFEDSQVPTTMPLTQK